VQLTFGHAKSGRTGQTNQHQTGRDKTRQKAGLVVFMNSDFRGVLIALIIIIVIFALGMAGHFLG
jgi:hypothetical protein